MSSPVQCASLNQFNVRRTGSGVICQVWAETSSRYWLVSRYACDEKPSVSEHKTHKNLRSKRVEEVWV